MRRSLVLCAALGLLAGCSRGNNPSSESTATASARSSAALATTAPSDGSSDAKPFGAPCVGDAECAGSVCFHKRIKGPDSGTESRRNDDPVEHDGYCSIRCNDDADCPVPPTRGRCGARGMCKRQE